MSTFMKISFIIGAILTIGGSFLPWLREGDLITYYYPGIRIFPSIHDNGGFIILLLSIALIVLVFRPPDFIGRPTIWCNVVAVALILASVFHGVKWIVNRANMNGVIGAIEIQIGLIMVFIGSVILLSLTMLHHLKSVE
jgi:hypothetical protein